MTICPILGLFPGVAVVWLLSLHPLLSCIILLTWVLPLSSQLPFITLFCTLFMTQLGYLHLTSASLRCYNSSSKSPGVLQTDLALWASVPMTLYLADRLWWLSHCKYWSVSVGLQCTLILGNCLPLVWTRYQEKGSPILLITFNSELYAWFYTVDMIQEKLFMGLLLNDKSAIHKPVPIPGGARGRPECFSLKMFHVQVSYYGAYWWPYNCAFNLFIKLVLKGEVCIMQTEPQQLYDVLYW